MILTKTTPIPATHIWNEEDIPPACEPMCGVSIMPVQFIVVWVAFMALDQPRTNPVTMMPEKRHILVGKENWWFMTQSGCRSFTPSGYPTQPYAHSHATVIVPTKDAPTHKMRWTLLAMELGRNGALKPGTVKPLAGIQELIPLPGTVWAS
jgi:hypothetical protein